MDRIDLADLRRPRCKQRCNGCRVSGEKTGDGAQLRLDKRDSPPTFTIASPRSSEGEAMAKAGGKEKEF